MPLTFFAHQVPVLPLKLRWGNRVDGTALCIGSMTADMAYPMGTWLARESHTIEGAIVWSMPATLVICWAIRAFVASTAFAHFPDLDPLRLHSLRVLGARRPRVVTTLLCAALGIAAHIILDSFTHAERLGSRLVGFDRIVATLPGVGDLTIAKILQLLGHSVGSLVGLAFLAWIGCKRLLEEWYGVEAVERVRSFGLTRRQRVAFWGTVALGLPAGLLWSRLSTTTGTVFMIIDMLAAFTVLACLLPWTRPVEM